MNHDSDEPAEIGKEFDSLLVDSTLAAIEADAPLSQIEIALRSLGQFIQKADPIRRAMVREAAIRKLRAAGVSSPAALADVALGCDMRSAGSVGRIPMNAVEPWPEPVNGAVLLEDMARTIRRFVVLPDASCDAEALWTLNTYVHDVASVLPNLCLSSPEKRCGKTRNLEILGCLVDRPLHTANVTVAALCRAIDKYGPTLLIDEADTVFVNGGGNAELRGILNAGLYRSNAFVLRCSGERNEPKVSSVWCPKVIALIGRLPATLEDRSIVIAMQRRTPEERVELFRYEKRFTEFESIRRKATRWASDHREHLRNAEPALPEHLHDRAQDLWSPLLAIADVLGAEWPERARRAAVELSAVERSDPSTAIPLLAAMKTIFEERRAERLSSEDIVQELMQREDGPWAEWIRGKPLTQAQLARLLAPFGIRPTIVYRSRNQVSRGYLVQHCADAFARYLPKTQNSFIVDILETAPSAYPISPPDLQI